MQLDNLQQVIANALAEDIGSGDITAELIPADQSATAKIICREDAVICGTNFVNEIFRQLDPDVIIDWQVKNGSDVKADQVVCVISGKARALVTGERCALNFLQTLSAVSTVTKQYYRKLQGTTAQLLDTRKTLPSLRHAQKYAVICGGGNNHRLGLFDAFLIKENHISVFGNITTAVEAARKLHPGKTLEVEVKNIDELLQALAAGVDLVMLDNFDLVAVREAVKFNNGKAKLEVSGNVTLENINEIAKTGVDYISVGALTKNIQAIDFTMLIA